MIIDIHGDYTTEPQALRQFRQAWSGRLG